MGSPPPVTVSQETLGDYKNKNSMAKYIYITNRRFALKKVIFSALHVYKSPQMAPRPENK